MPTIDVRIDSQDSGETRYVYDDSGDYLYMTGGYICHCDSAGDITGVCDMVDLPMLIKALERIRDDNRPTVSSGIMRSTRST